MQMDTEEIKKSIAERFNNLQPEIQDAIMSSNYEKNLYEIAQKHKLNVEQLGELELNTTLVLLGQTHPDEYADELEEDLKLPKEKIGEIVTDVNERIMKNIRELIKKNFADDDETEAQAEVPVPPYIASEMQKPAPVAEKTITQPTTTVPTPKVESSIYGKAGIEILDGVDMISQKLKGVTMNKSVVSDHSIPKVTPTTPQAPAPTTPSTRARDPYHEVID